jgi:hypothetical protein
MTRKCPKPAISVSRKEAFEDVEVNDDEEDDDDEVATEEYAGATVRTDTDDDEEDDDGGLTKMDTPCVGA